MAATPFKLLLETMYDNGSAGPSYRGSGSDVAGEFISWDDLPGTPDAVPFPPGLRLADIQVSAAGVDTKALRFTRGTAETDHIVRDAKLVETLALDAKQRLGRLYGISLRANIQYGLKQIA